MAVLCFHPLRACVFSQRWNCGCSSRTNFSTTRCERQLCRIKRSKSCQSPPMIFPPGSSRRSNNGHLLAWNCFSYTAVALGSELLEGNDVARNIGLALNYWICWAHPQIFNIKAYQNLKYILQNTVPCVVTSDLD